MMTLATRLRTVLLCIALPGTALVASCGQTDPAAEAGGPPPVPAQLQALTPTTLEDSSDFVGNLQAANIAQVRSEIEGRIRRVLVTPGDVVSAGTVLLQIEPDRVTSQVESAEAGVAAAEASRATAVQQLAVAESQLKSARSVLELRETNFERARFLTEEGAIGQFRFDEARNDLNTARNDVASAQETVEAARKQIEQADAEIRRAQAEVESQRVSLGFKDLTAPIAGVLGDLLVKEGDYLSVGGAVTTIAENQFLDLRISVPSTRSRQLRPGLAVDLFDPATGDRLGQGRIDFVAPTVERGAQSILTKARFSNVSGNLRDGQYVQARIVWDTDTGILVPTIAVTRISGRDFVYLADDSGEQTVVNLTLVELGDLQDGGYQVRDGLEPGDRVAVSNILKLRDGAPVDPNAATEAARAES